jgi:hypothetical protein
MLTEADPLLSLRILGHPQNSCVVHHTCEERMPDLLAITIVPFLKRQEERSRWSAPQSIANGSSVGTPDQLSPLPSSRSNQYGPTTLTPVGVGLPIVNVAWNPVKKPVPLEYTQSPCPVVVAVG